MKLTFKFFSLYKATKKRIATYKKTDKSGIKNPKKQNKNTTIHKKRKVDGNQKVGLAYFG